MPWKDKTVKELREEFIQAVKASGNMSSACREFGITRRTGYKWLERADENEELEDRSHAPFHVPGKTAGELEERILAIRADNPGWGPKKILGVLENEGYTGLPCVRTVGNILKRNGCISTEESEKRRAFLRYQKEHCNEMWQADFKGDFMLMDGSRCFPLDILDDCSRFCIRLEAKNHARGVLESFEHAFMEFGLPDSILTDHGSQFAGFRNGYTQFERWLMDHDVSPIHGRILHPQTQGKIERFHRTMKDELLRHRTFSDLASAKHELSEWREKYNHIRPHEALGLRCPADVYHASARQYVRATRPYEYCGLYPICKVNNWGYLRFSRIQVYLSETMADTCLEIREEDGCFSIYYRNYRIAQIDPETGKLANRIITRSDERPRV